jgi:hypothetical protein
MFLMLIVKKSHCYFDVCGVDTDVYLFAQCMSKSISPSFFHWVTNGISARVKRNNKGSAWPTLFPASKSHGNTCSLVLWTNLAISTQQHH